MAELSAKVPDDFAALAQAVFVVSDDTRRVVEANLAACRALDLSHEEVLGQLWADLKGRLSAKNSVAPPARDALTGLATRTAIHERFDNLERAGVGVGLLFIDLDDFKTINDTHGHLLGDRVLCALADRLASGLRPDDLAARWGGDEFVVLVEGVIERRDLDRLARRLARLLHVPVTLEGREFAVTASIGAAVARDARTTLDELLSEADRAMYVAKRKRGTRVAPR